MNCWPAACPDPVHAKLDSGRLACAILSVARQKALHHRIATRQYRAASEAVSKENLLLAALVK